MNDIIFLFTALLALASTAGCIFLAFRQRRTDNADDSRRFEEEQRLFRQQMDQMRAETERRIEEMNRRSTLEFENLSRRMLDFQQRAMGEANRTQISDVLSPLKQRLEEFSKTVADNHLQENAGRKSLEDQIERLMRLNITISDEAKALTRALKGDSKVQGDWGETILKELLEKAGLKDGINFTMQATRDAGGGALRDEEGNLRRPDFVVHLPGERNLVVDSKVSVTAFVDYCSAEDDDERLAAAKRLAESVRRHIDELAAKQYQKIVDGSAEQVVMFMPVEGAYFKAVDHDRNLIDYAFRKHVVIATPTHLLSLIHLIEQMWRVDRQNRNAAEIARLGGLIFDKLAQFTRDFESVEKGIRQTEEAYQKSLKDLTTGPTSVMARARRMQELGAKTTKHLSEKTIESMNLFNPEKGLTEDDSDGFAAIG